MSDLRKAVFDAYIAATIGVLLAVFYHGSLLSYASTLRISDYSYLIVLIPIALFVADRIVSRYSSLGRVDIFAFVSSSGGVILAVSIFVLSEVITEYSVQLEVLSAVILAGSIILFVYGEFKNTLAPLSIWILLLTLIPLPRSFIDYLASVLTKPLASATAMIAGGRLLESAGYFYIAVTDNLGVERKFYVSPECSGIISLLSVAALTPIIMYIISLSKTSVSKKILSFLYSISSAAIITFTGNIVRIALMIYITRTIGYSTAITFFHQTPSIIYAGVATIVAIYIAVRYTPPPRIPQSKRIQTKVETSYSLLGSDIMKVFAVLLLVFLFVFLAQTVAARSVVSNSVSNDPDLLLTNPEKVVFNSTDLNISYNTQTKPLIGEALGALNVHSLTLKWQNITATGWVEVAETPSRFHGWQVCLSAQGYRIERWWTETGNLTINYAVVSKASQKLLLVYTIVRYPTNIGTLYVKISLFSPVTEGNYRVKAQKLTMLMQELNLPTQPSNAVENTLTLLYTGLTLIISASLIGFIYKVNNSRTHKK